MARRILQVLTLIVIAICLPLELVPADQEQAQKEPTTANQVKPFSLYHIDFSISENAEGKRLNSRHYVFWVDTSEKFKGSLRVGNRVPIATGPLPQQFNYYDVGMNIDYFLSEQSNLLGMRLILEMSSIAPSDALGDSKTNPPIIRTMKTDLQTVLTPGKPTVVGTLDDTASNHRYEIEVSATKMK